MSYSSLSISPRLKSPDNNYRVQPKKFDGYFQCPRPALKIQFKKKIRLKDDILTIPRPVQTLIFSSVYDKTVSPPSIKTPPPRSKIRFSNKFSTIDDIKQQLLPPLSQEVKTARQLGDMLENSKKTNRSFKQKEKKPERRKLKGYFMAQVPSSSELFKKEKILLTLTNPVSAFKQKKFEELDRKYLEKRREQKILKNKLVIINK